VYGAVLVVLHNDLVEPAEVKSPVMVLAVAKSKDLDYQRLLLDGQICQVGVVGPD
jgi:hypothetical protein